MGVVRNFNNITTPYLPMNSSLLHFTQIWGGGQIARAPLPPSIS